MPDLSRICTAFWALFAGAAVAAQEPEWRLYRPSNTGIPGDFAYSIFVDSQDRVHVSGFHPFWDEGGFGTSSSLDPDLWTTFSNVDHPEIISPRFNDIEEAPDGMLWIATDAELVGYNPDIGPSSIVRYDSGNSPMPPGQVRDIAIEPTGAVWVATQIVSTVNGGLARFDPATSTWSTWGPFAPSGHSGTSRVAVLPDASGPGFEVWFNPSLADVLVYRDGVISPPPSSGGITPQRLASTRPVDNLGNMWVYTNQGLARRNPDGTYIVVGNPPNAWSTTGATALRNGRIAVARASNLFIWDGGWISLDAWGGSDIYGFAEDSQGNLWAGGLGGAARMASGSTFWQRYRLTNTAMKDFFIDTIDFAPDGRVFMNGNAGVGIGGFNILVPPATPGGTERWIGVNNHNYGLGPVWGFGADNIGAVHVRAGGTVAIAPGNGGIVDWNGFSYTTLLPEYGISRIEEDGLGRIWGGSRGFNSVFLVDGAQWTEFHHNNSQLASGQNVAIVADPDNPGFVWLAQEFGIAYTNGTQWQLTPREAFGLTQNTISEMITSFAVGHDGAWWIGSGKGLRRYNPATQQYTVHDRANAGFGGDTVTRLSIAPDGTVWAATYDFTWPNPGSLSHFGGEVWTHYTTLNSPLPHTQIMAVESRSVEEGYEVWVGAGSMGIAVLTIAGDGCYANCDGSAVEPVLNVDDFTCFINEFAQAQGLPQGQQVGHYANCDGSTVAPVLNVDDFTCFINQFAAGCR